MARIEKSIQVDVPVQTAYNQWTQFEEFPRFMEGVREVHQVDDARLTWVAEVSGERKEWNARITQQVPDQVVAWESEGGMPNAGVVTFHRLGAERTEVNVQMDYEPEDLKEVIGDKLGFVTRRVEGDLKRFKEFIEERGRETGAWRGRIGSEGVRGDGGRQGLAPREDAREGGRPETDVPHGPGQGRTYGGEGADPAASGMARDPDRRDHYGAEGTEGTSGPSYGIRPEDGPRQGPQEPRSR